MLDGIVDALKDQVGSSLMEKIGLDQTQSDNSLNAAGSSVMDLLGGGDGLDMGDVLNLFSKDDNKPGADNVLGQLGSTFMGKLTGEVGLDSDKASGVSNMVLPLLTSMMADKIGGDKNNLSGMVGGLAGNLLGGGSNAASGLLGTVGKLFGK